jgi:VCBS repeat-containing protein
MNAISKPNRSRLPIAIAFAFGVFAYTVGTGSAVGRIFTPLTAEPSVHLAPIAAPVSPANMERADVEAPPTPTSVTFEVYETACAGSWAADSTTVTFSVNGSPVATLDPRGDCTCGPAAPKSVTVTDPAVLALFNDLSCVAVSMTWNNQLLIGWARAVVTGPGGTQTITLVDKTGGFFNQVCYAWETGLTYGNSLPDADGDGMPNCSDPDSDNDGILDGADNCPADPNPGQADADSDGIGDACEPLVAAVPWLGNEARPHVVYSGGTLMLQASASIGGTGAPMALTSGTWDPGDGTGPVAINVSNSRVLQLAHVYTGAIGQPFTATVSVTDGTNTYTDTFKVQIQANTDEVRANMAIDHGLWNLHKSMALSADQGSWSENHGYPEAATGSAVQAFEINGHRPGGNAATDPYVANARRGLRWLFANLRSGATSSNGADNPDSNGNGIWLGPNQGNNHESYISGQVIDAIVASGTPTATATAGNTDVRGRQYKDIVQDMLDGYAHGASSTGGWIYTFQRCCDDSSASHWWAIGVLAGEGWGLDSPAWLKTRNWTAGIPNWQYFDGSNAGADGRCGYRDQGPIWDGGLNVTPACMMMMSADDQPAATTARFKAGEGFMDRNFGSSLGNLYSMYQLTKAMRTAVNGSGVQTPITLLNGTRDWYAQYRTQLIGQQAGDGHWDSTTGSPGIAGNLGTAWAIIILSPSLFSIPPDAVCTADPSTLGTTGGLVNFSSAGTTHPDETATIVSYSWNFDDAGATAATANASHTFAQPGSFPFVHNVTLTVTDSNGLTDTTSCPVTIVDTNVPPNANTGGPYEFCLGSTLTLDGSTSIDPDDSITSYAWSWGAVLNFSTPNATTAVVDATAAFTALGVGSYNLGLQVTDEFGHTNAEFSSVNVKAADAPGCNQPPVANDNAFSTNEDTSLSGNVVGDDTDGDGDALTATLGTGTTNGTLSLSPNGDFTYTPNANFCGTDSFTYSVSDGTASDDATVTITVTCVNDAPTADDDSNSTAEDTPVSGSVAGNDTSVDVEGDPLTFSLGSGPSNGSVVFDAAGSYTYTPNANFCGTDSFTYSISDGTASDSATVTITVTCVNDAPVANDNNHTTPEDTAVSGVATASDVDGDTLTYALGSVPSNGTVTFNSNGSYTYTPNANYNGPDSFTFTVSDGNGGSDTGQVNINVTPVNDVPVCTAAAPSTSLLWAPNHQLFDITINGVVDPVENSAITITIDDIWQDEPTNTIGDGNTSIDGYGVGTSTAQVRAERAGSNRVPGNGRVYHIYFTGTDAQGGQCTGEVQVGVPHDQGQQSVPVDDGKLFKSTGL